MTAHDGCRRGWAVLLSVLVACALVATPPAALADEEAADGTTLETVVEDSDSTDGQGEADSEAADDSAENTDAGVDGQDPTQGPDSDDGDAEEGEEPSDSGDEEEPPVIPVHTIDDGDYYISASTAVRRVLDVKSAGTANGVNVQLYETNLTGAQKWHVVYDEETGYYTITCVGTGKALDVTSAKRVSGTNVQQYQSNGTPAQQWEIVDNGDGTFTIKSALSTDELELVLDRASGSTASGTNIQVYKANGTAAQKWTFTSTAAPVVDTDDADTSLADGWYVITSSLSSSYGVDIASASTSAGANAQLYKTNGTLAQVFKLVRTGSFYTIQPGCSSMRLEAAGGNFFPGTNVRQNTADSSAAQQWKLVARGDGSYTLVNRATGTALEVTGSAVANGTNLQVNPVDGSPAQGFVFSPKADFLSEGTYSILSACSSKYVDVASASKSVGANVQIYQGNATQAQKWQVELVDAEAGTYRFRAICSGLYLCMDEGGNVCQRAKGTTGTEWTLEPSAGKYVLANVARGKVLDVAGAGKTNGTNVQGYAANGTSAQLFSFSTTPLLSSGTYAIKHSANSSLAIDVKAAGTANGTNIQLYAWNNTGAQKWKITYNSDGTYTVLNAANGKALDVTSAKAVSGTNVQLYTSNNTKAQRWYITDNGEGTFYLESALDRNLVLDVGAASSGSNAKIYTKNGTANQRFTFMATTYTAPKATATASTTMNSKAMTQSSNTKYLIIVDRANCKVGIYTGSRGAWVCSKYWSCCVGKASTPTPTGTYKVTGKGLRFGENKGYTCWYYTQFYGDYLFHSQPYNVGSQTSIQDASMGKWVSHGCVRLTLANAKWIYDYVPIGTKVVIY